MVILEVLPSPLSSIPYPRKNKIEQLKVHGKPETSPTSHSCMVQQQRRRPHRNPHQLCTIGRALANFCSGNGVVGVGKIRVVSNAVAAVVVVAFSLWTASTAPVAAAAAKIGKLLSVFAAWIRKIAFVFPVGKFQARRKEEEVWGKEEDRMTFV